MTKSEIVQRVQDRLKVRESYATLFKSENPVIRDASERVMRDLFRTGFITRSPFVPGDVHQTCRNLGAQRLLVHILERTYGKREDIIAEITKHHEDI